jgi:hydrogenase nickel incorporation protein HypA/HybF
MHELSIAMGIVEIARKEAAKAKVDVIKAIDLEIGTLSGVEIDSLNFAWPMAIDGSVLQNAEKRIHVIEAKARCFDCDYEFDIKNLFDSCPKCGSHFKNIYKGKEMRVKSIEI